MAKKRKQTRKQRGLAEIEFTSGDTGAPFVETKGTFANGLVLRKNHDDVADAILHIAISTPSSRNKLAGKTIDVPAGSTVTITYG